MCGNTSQLTHIQDPEAGRQCVVTSQLIHIQDLEAGRQCGNTSQLTHITIDTHTISDNSMYFNVIQLQYENVLFVQLEF